MSRWTGRLRTASLVACLIGTSALAVTQHEHHGIIPAYNGAPPKITLSALERAALEHGEAVYKSIDGNGAVGGVATFRVNASPATVWSVISDFGSYPAWVDGLVESDVYRREGDHVYVRFRYRHWLLGNYTYYVHHIYPQEKTGWGTWTLDYSRRSDLDDSVGFWRVSGAPGYPPRSDVTYATDVRLKGWLASSMRGVLVRNALETATGWVKEQSEQRHSNYSRQR